MSSPSSNNITTYDSTIIFAGATDPNFKTTFNGKDIEVTEKGYFSLDAALEVGTNTFKISHKGKTVTYTVLRKVKLLESVTPTGNIEVDGGTSITITVKAFAGSSVTAKIGGTTVTLKEQKAEDVSDTTVNLNYVNFEGTYKAPAAIETVQNLGNISVTASWQGYSESLKGAGIKVHAKPKPVGEIVSAIQITEKYAETFPTDRLNDQSQPNCYPLPAGTVDFVVGNELTFTNSEGTFKYYTLMSGHRVYSKDTKSLGQIEKTNNKISAVNLTYDGRFVNLKFDNSWSVPFKYIELPELDYRFYNGDNSDYTLKKEYQITQIVYRLFYTDEVDLSKITMDANPLVSKVECALGKVKVGENEIPVCDIKLTLKTAGGFFGATPSYTNDNKTLDIRLNTPAPIQKANNAYGYTLKGAVIIVDAGHNKTSPGAVGKLEDAATGVRPYSEYVLNAQVRDYLVSTLKSLGATVITIDNERMPTAAQRLEYFQSVNPHLMICIHHNDSTASSPRGAVGTYFNAYSQLLSKSIMTSVCADYLPSGSNRAYDYYFSRLKMTREQYYPSMLIECGFMSNAKQLEELIVPENQKKIANNIAKGLVNYFVKTGSLNYAEFEKPDDETSSSQPSDGSSKPSDTSSNPSDSSSVTSSEIATSEAATNETVAYLEPKRMLA
ncbi:MAG: N-acetylmuramoyl-L-alanine amidase, partial [Oscillospiraceae bacterium]|nr:N-acetylmuramoyl-L-alanine amidase [Oscillospiraceae bacterium]